jgi:putative phosphoesterase
MDVGIISDIHGDLAALQTVLDRLDNFHRTEFVLCAGDLVGRGPHPDEVVRLIRERGIPTVRGNYDDAPLPLADETLGFLRGLPLDWRGTIHGRRIFMCHGKPGSYRWGLYRDHISATLLDMMLASLNADVLITGHTHVPLYMRVGRGCVINPGSLFTFQNVRATSHTYGILRLSDMSFDLYDLAEPVGERSALAI